MIHYKSFIENTKDQQNGYGRNFEKEEGKVGYFDFLTVNKEKMQDKRSHIDRRNNEKQQYQEYDI